MLLYYLDHLNLTFKYKVFSSTFLFENQCFFGVLFVAQWKRIWLVSMRVQVWSLGSLSGLRIWHCHKLWCRSQTRLGSGITVAVEYAGGCTSDVTPSPGTSICLRHGPKKAKKRKSVVLNRKSLTWISLVVHRVRDLVSLQWLGSLLWRGFNPQPGNSHISQAQPKKIK